MDYRQYVYTKRERIRYGSCGGTAAFVILMLFYDNVVVCGIGAVSAAVLFLKYYRRILIKILPLNPAHKVCNLSV